jgi:hypothetical protein
MIRKLFCAVVVMTVAVGFVLADEFQGAITKIDGDKVTVQKMKGKGKGKGAKAEKDGDPVTMSIAKDAKIVKGKFDMEAKKMVAGDAIEGGLKHEMFSKVSEDMPVMATITTDADNKSITTIMVGGGKKKKAAN